MPETAATGVDGLARVSHAFGSYVVDLAAIAAIAYLASLGLPADVTQVLGGFIVAVAGVKKYAELKTNA